MAKVLILTAWYGQGHNTAAYNIEQFLIQKKHQVEVVDMAQFVWKKVGEATQRLYTLTAEKLPFVRERAFDLFDSEFARELMFTIRPVRYQSRFDQLVHQFAPDVVIVTFPFWNWFLKKYLKTRPKTFELWIVITDAITIHQTWYLDQKWVDKRFLIDTYSKQMFVKKFKVAPDKVEVSFFPILPDKFVDKSNITGKNVILLLSMLMDDDYLWQLLDDASTIPDMNVMVLKGKAPELFDQLKTEFKAAKNIRFEEFVPLVDEFWKKDRIYIGKPGWATVAEAIATDVPMIVPVFYPGQEEGNLALIELAEIGFFVPDPTLTLAMLKYLDWNKILPNFKKIKKQDAIPKIAQSLGIKV